MTDIYKPRPGDVVGFEPLGDCQCEACGTGEVWRLGHEKGTVWVHVTARRPDLMQIADIRLIRHVEPDTEPVTVGDLDVPLWDTS